jgi:hypothetical protein
MFPNDSQMIIIRYLNTVEYATSEELYRISDRSYYCNAGKNFSVFISRMVAQGFIERIKPGVFKKGKSMMNKPIQQEDPNQLSLFN